MAGDYIRSFMITFGLAFIMTALSLGLHLATPSSIHAPESDWAARLEYHQTNDAFKVRPLTTPIVEWMHRSVGFSVKTSFFLLQFLLFLISGPGFYFYLRQLPVSSPTALTGMTIYYLSFPVLLAHFDPVYTWDDFWVYIAIPFSFAFLLRRAVVLSLAALALSILARETSLIFVPIWIYCARTKAGVKCSTAICLAAGAIAVAAGIRYYFADGALSGEQTIRLSFNFTDWPRTRDTIFSLVVSCGFLWVVGIYQAIRLVRTQTGGADFGAVGAIVSSIGFILATLLLAYARETRLFFPPFVFLIPLTLAYLSENMDDMHAIWKRFSPLGRSAMIGAIFAVSIAAAMILFPDFEFRTWKDGSRAYFALHLALCLLFILLELVRRRRPMRKSLEYS